MKIPAIGSPSLEIVTVFSQETCRRVPPPPLLMTFLPTCFRLQEVRVQSWGEPPEGTAVKIRCYSCSPRNIVPLDAYARQAEAALLHPHSLLLHEVGAEFLPMPCSPLDFPEGLEAYSIAYAYHAAGHEQPPVWGHVVMPDLIGTSVLLNNKAYKACDYQIVRAGYQGRCPHRQDINILYSGPSV